MEEKVVHRSCNTTCVLDMILFLLQMQRAIFVAKFANAVLNGKHGKRGKNWKGDELFFYKMKSMNNTCAMEVGFRDVASWISLEFCF